MANNLKKIIPLEYDEAIALVEYLELKGFLFTHIPAETFTRNWGTRMKNKRMGVRKGFPDYAIIVKDMLVFVELKRIKGSKIAPEQLRWNEELNKINGVVAIIARGADQAIKYIENIIK